VAAIRRAILLGNLPGNLPGNSMLKPVFPKTFDRFRGLWPENPPNREEVA
jgi:hypothetical protein